MMMDDMSRLELENQVLKEQTSSIYQAIKVFTEALASVETKCDEQRLQSYTILQELVPQDSRSRLDGDKKGLQQEIEDCKRIATEQIGKWLKTKEDHLRLRDEDECWNHFQQIAKEKDATTETLKLSAELEELRIEKSRLCAREEDLELKVQKTTQARETYESSMLENIHNLDLTLKAEVKKMTDLMMRMEVEKSRTITLSSENRKVSHLQEQAEKNISDLKAESEILKSAKLDLESERNKLRQEFEEYKKNNDAIIQQLIEDKHGPQVAANGSLMEEVDDVELLSSHLSQNPDDSTFKYPAAASEKQKMEKEIIDKLRNQMIRLETKNSILQQKKHRFGLELERIKQLADELIQELDIKMVKAAEPRTKEFWLRYEIDQVNEDIACKQAERRELKRRLDQKKQEITNLVNKFKAKEREESNKVEKMKAGIAERQEEINSLRMWNDEARKLLETSASETVRIYMEKLQEELLVVRTESESLHDETQELKGEKAELVMRLKGSGLMFMNLETEVRALAEKRGVAVS